MNSNQTFLTPPYLQSGDTVGICAPARKISPDELQNAVSILKSWGLNVVFSPHLFKSLNQFSGSDSERAIDFQGLIDDVDIKAIFCARGGYGSVRIIDKINFSSFIRNPKWIVGYSDITVFHAHIHRHFSTETLHAAMPINMTTDGITPDALKTMKSALFGDGLIYSTNSHPYNKQGKAEAVITGGNLSVIYSLMGSSSDVDTENKILFIEDLDEYLYHIDRMMMCLERAGKLYRLAGLIVGGMNKMNDNSIPFGKSPYEIIAEITEKYNYPICFDFPAGHFNNNNALILGRRISMNVMENACEIRF
ncbi:MAG: LD-carboxypeptidase [Bacteroidales bacterium]|nr:LD-carboxypeptidase [Bacteroidales bacterium]